MYSERINLHKQISDSREILREKFKKFKTGEHYVQDKVNKVFKPIIEPLNKLVETSNTKKKKKLRHSTPEISDSLGEDNTDDSDDIWKFATAHQRVTHDTRNNSLGESSQNFSDHVLQNLSKTKNQQSTSNVKYDLQQTKPEITHYDENDNNNNNNENIENNGNRDVVIKEQKSISKYLNQVKNKDSRVDMTFRVRKLVKGYKFGDSSFSHKDDYFKIKGERYKITPGLTELIFKKNPERELITTDDIDTYRKLVVKTNTHKKGYKADKSIRTDKSEKFQTYLAGFITGNGFKIAKKNDVIEYVYWDNPNELVERLKLLDAEKAAGNNNHDNEIQNILEELRENGYI